jgi:hypothetical protein
MAGIAAGGRILLRVGDQRLVLRALRPADITGVWSIPVLGAVEAIGAGEGVAEIPTIGGVLRVHAQVVLIDGAVALQASGSHEAMIVMDADADPIGCEPPTPGTSTRSEPVVEQRRDNVRGALDLHLRGALVTGPGSGVDDELALRGTTSTVSAGGFSAQVEVHRPYRSTTTPRRLGSVHTLRPGAQVYVELELPDDLLVPTIVEVVTYRRDIVRAKFLEIAPIDRERLVRLVFVEQRRLLAQRQEQPSTETVSGPEAL